MFGASTKDCNSVFGQNTSSRAESDLNADGGCCRDSGDEHTNRYC